LRLIFRDQLCGLLFRERDTSDTNQTKHHGNVLKWLDSFFV
jgi:hypothetical protein